MPAGALSHLESSRRWRKNNPEKCTEQKIKQSKRYYERIAAGEDLNYDHPSVTETLKKHKKDLKDDPEKLSDEFIKAMLGR